MLNTVNCSSIEGMYLVHGHDTNDDDVPGEDDTGDDDDTDMHILYTS